MLQYFIYIRQCAIRENAQVHKKRVKNFLPREGEIIIFELTDKQFGMIEIFRKIKKVNKPDTPQKYANTNRKGISSTELCRKLGLRQKTWWFLKPKVMRAMKSSGQFNMSGKAEVDETIMEEKGVRARKNNKKRLVVFGIERKGKGMSQVYDRGIRKSSAKEIGAFMEEDSNAQIKTVQWPSYSPLRALCQFASSSIS